MQEYLLSGIQLGWLFNPKDQQIEIYRPNPPETHSLPPQLSGESVLPGFTLTVPRF